MADDWHRPFGSQPTDDDLWTLDAEHLEETRRALELVQDPFPMPVLVVDCEQPNGTVQFPLLRRARDEPGSAVGNLTCIRLRTRPRTFAPDLDLGRPGTLRVVRDKQVNGIVVYARDVPVIALAGPFATRAPKGLIHLEASRMRPKHLGRLLEGVGESLRSLDIGDSKALAREPRLDFLRHAPHLRHLDLRHSAWLRDLRPIADLPELRCLLLFGCPVAKLPIVDELQSALPALEICR